MWNDNRGNCAQSDVSLLFSACPGKGVARGKTRTGATLMVFPLLIPWWLSKAPI